MARRGGGTGAAVLELLITADPSDLISALDRSENAVTGFVGGIANTFMQVGQLTGALVLAEAAVETFRIAFEGMKDAIVDVNDHITEFGVQLSKVMEGDVKAATGKMLELRDISRTSDFPLESLAIASRFMRNLGGTALDTTENIKLFQDVAAGTGNKLELVASTLSRVYGLLQEGEPIGRVTLQLQRMGMVSANTIAEVIKLQEAGAGADEVWEVLRKSLEKFIPAADEITVTLQNSAELIQKNLNFLAAVGFAPLYESIRLGLHAISQSLASDQTQQWAYNVGGAIQVLIDQIAGLVPAASRAGSMFTSFIEGLGNNIIGLINLSAQWGSDFIGAFAEGMASALNLVVAVIEELANILTFWMAPGSPPKFLPFIDRWGLATAEEWLKGFNSADVSVINELSAEVEQQLRNAFAMGKDFDLFESIMSVREALVEAVKETREFGSVSEETWAQIHAATEPIGGDIDRQIQLYIDLADAQMEVAEATGELKRLQEEYNDALRPLDREIDKLQTQERIMRAQHDLGKAMEAQAKGKDPGGVGVEQAQLKMRILQMQIQRDQLKLNHKDELDAAEDRVDAAKEDEENTKSQIDQLKGVNQWIKKNIDLWNEFNKVASGGGGGGKGAGGAGGALSNFTADLEMYRDRLEKEKERIKAALDDMTLRFKPATDAVDGLLVPFGKLGISINNAWNQLLELNRALKGTAELRGQKEEDASFGANAGGGAPVKNQFATMVAEASIKLAEFTSSWETFISSIGQVWEDHSISITHNVTRFWDHFKIVAINAIGIIVELLATAFVGEWNLISAVVQTIWATMWTGLRSNVTAALLLMAGDFEGAKKSIITINAQLWEEIKKVWSEHFSDFEKSAKTAFRNIEIAIENLKNFWNGVINGLPKWPTGPTNPNPKSNAVDMHDPNDQNFGAFTGLGNGSGDLGEKGQALGTDFFAGGLTMVGERGAELVKLPTGSQVFNHDNTLEMIANNQKTEMPFAWNPTYVINGGDRAEIERAIKKSSSETLTVFRDQLQKIASRR